MFVQVMCKSGKYILKADGKYFGRPVKRPNGQTRFVIPDLCLELGAQYVKET